MDRKFLNQAWIVRRGWLSPATAIVILMWIGATFEAASGQPPQLNPPAPALFPAPKPGPTPPPVPTPVAPKAPEAAVTPSATSALIPSPEKLSEQVTRLLRDLVPREFENRKKWGMTKKVVRGVDIDRDGFRLKTHRRWKEVKDGLWKRYKARLDDPEERLQLDVVAIEEAGPGRVRMDVVLLCSLDLEGQIVKYQRNLRLLSLTAIADATIKLEMSVEFGASLDPTKLPPDVVFDIVVQDAQLELVKFKLRRLSDIRGGAAKQLGKLVEDFAEEEIKDQRVKLVEKLNKKIEKKRDRLRFSFQDLLPDSLRNTNDPSADATDGAAEADGPKTAGKSKPGQK